MVLPLKWLVFNGTSQSKIHDLGYLISGNLHLHLFTTEINIPYHQSILIHHIYIYMKYIHIRAYHLPIITTLYVLWGIPIFPSYHIHRYMSYIQLSWYGGFLKWWYPNSQYHIISYVRIIMTLLDFEVYPNIMIHLDFDITSCITWSSNLCIVINKYIYIYIYLSIGISRDTHWCFGSFSQAFHRLTRWRRRNERWAADLCGRWDPHGTMVKRWWNNGGCGSDVVRKSWKIVGKWSFNRDLIEI